MRFCTVAGELGSADTVRDPRGFSVKFYTEEDNWDLVGNIVSIMQPVPRQIQIRWVGHFALADPEYRWRKGWASPFQGLATA